MDGWLRRASAAYRGGSHRVATCRSRFVKRAACWLALDASARGLARADGRQDTQRGAATDTGRRGADSDLPRFPGGRRVLLAGQNEPAAPRRIFTMSNSPA